MNFIPESFPGFPPWPFQDPHEHGLSWTHKDTHPCEPCEKVLLVVRNFINHHHIPCLCGWDKMPGLLTGNFPFQPSSVFPVNVHGPRACPEYYQYHQLMLLLSISLILSKSSINTTWDWVVPSSSLV